MEFEVGDEVLLSTKNLTPVLKNDGSNKLGPLYVGPFKVLEKLTGSYKLQLPQHMKIHPIFHVSQLRLYRVPKAKRCRYHFRDPVETVEGKNEYEVDEVVNHRVRRRGKSRSRTGKLEYLVFWTGYPAHEAIWEPEENLQNAQEKVRQYYKRIEGNAESKEGGL